jgi:glyoxylase-like metal-dependent hydrolase (beta-lactamase superfamily II)
MGGAERTRHPFSRPERVTVTPLVGPGELQKMLASAEPPLLLDVRPASERRLAQLRNDRHLPLHDLPKRVAELPRGRPIVAYDHYGADARRATDFLRSRGYEAVALEGGIDEYSRLNDPTIPRYDTLAPESEVVLIEMPRADSGCLAYLLGDRQTRQAVIVDPGREVDPYLETLRHDDWNLAAIVETHTHADHLAGHARLHTKTDAPIYVSHRSPAQYPHASLREGEALLFGTQSIQVLETPGHTRDHLTLHWRDRIFTGDTLLIGGCGRTDLGDGSPELLWESLTEKILRLPDDTEVLPAHFGQRHALVQRYASSLGFERATNEALLQGSREAFLRYMTEGWPPKPTDFDQIVRENLTT